jgi:hypothetical protein
VSLSELGNLFWCCLVAKYRYRRVAWDKFDQHGDQRDDRPDDEQQNNDPAQST